RPARSAYPAGRESWRAWPPTSWSRRLANRTTAGTARTRTELGRGSGGDAGFRAVGPGTSHRAEHGTRRVPRGGDPSEPDPRLDADEDRFEAAAAEVRLVPERRAAPVTQVVAPPLPVGQCLRPNLERFEVAPVLTHAGVRRVVAVDEPLVQQQPVRLLGDR